MRHSFPTRRSSDLRKYLETVPIQDNGGKELNEGGALKYVVTQTHCHYDHILGVEDFASDSPILASSKCPGFLSPENLPAHSLCEALNIQTPRYPLALVPHLHDIVDGDQRNPSGTRLGVKVLHTPGHTPDELALWDEEEAMLYVGDTLYEHEPIIFPNEGSIVDWFSTVDDLIAFAELHSAKQPVQISCGHATAGKDAVEVLRATKKFMKNIVEEKEERKGRFLKRGLWHVEYRQEDGRFSLICPERLVEEARNARRSRSFLICFYVCPVQVEQENRRPHWYQKDW